jgi:DNA-binding CsgD family transcriptional regulator
VDGHTIGATRQSGRTISVFGDPALTEGTAVVTTAAKPGAGQNRAVPAPVRGRSAELKLIQAQMDSLRNGIGGVLVIEGAPGMGKSRLLTEAVAMAHRYEMPAQHGEASRDRQDVPFYPLFTAMLGGDHPVGNVEVLRELGNSTDSAYWVVDHLQAAIAAEARRSPFAIVLEDVHWADNGTLTALRSLTAALVDAPVLWVLTVRTGFGGAPVRETLTALDRAGATRLMLPALSRGPVADMVGDAVRARVDDSLLEMVAKARGNPFLVSEIVRGLREENRLRVEGGLATATGDELPTCLVACMQERLDRLSGEASEVTRVAAVLPARFSAGLLAAMMERQPTALVSALAETVEAGVLVADGEYLRFGHDLLREATRACLPQSLRQAMERQSAAVMLAQGAAPDQVAAVLARSAEPGDREAIAALRRAAQSVARSDVNAAADFTRRALELLPADDDEHGRLVAETVVLLNRARRYEESEELAVTALGAATADGEAEIRLRLPAFTRHGSLARAEENRRALLLGDISDVARARHLALLAYNLMMDDNDGSRRAAAEKTAAAADAVDDLESKAIANITLACFDCVTGSAGDALDRLKQLYSRSRASDLPIAHLLSAAHYANALAAVGHVDEAVDLISTRMVLARQARNAMALDVWATYDGMAKLAAGQLGAARVAAEAAAIPDRTDLTELDVLRAATLIEVALRTDDRNLLQQNLVHARAVFSAGSAMERRTAGHALAMAARYRDDIDDAAHWCHPDMELLGAPLTPQGLDQVIESARVAALTRDDARRARVLRAVDRLSRDELPLFAAVSLHARGILDADRGLLIRAAELLRASSRPLLYAAAAEDLGAYLLGTDDAEQAPFWLNAAFDTYSRAGAVTDARRVSRQLRQLGVERRIVSRSKAKTGWESLTDAELKVVTLVAQGATNRAVADHLHLSLHTVKTHVHNAFRKLGISSRAQLVHESR